MGLPLEGVYCNHSYHLTDLNRGYLANYIAL